MTRHEQLLDKVGEISRSNLKTADFGSYMRGFVEGAEWADNNPDVDVRTQVAWQAGRQAAIDEMCACLEALLHHDNVGGFWTDYTSKEEFINALKREIK